MGNIPKILLVDDDTDNLRFIQRLLEAEDYQVKTAHSGQKGLDALDRYRPDLVLLDMNMPGMDGLKTVDLLKRKENTAAVVFVTANSKTSDVVEGLDAGALDYIVKPFSGLEFLARVRAQLRVKALQDELRAANKKLQGLVEIDDLTGLYNMRSIYEKLDQEIERACRHGQGLATIMLDMDNFKSVNDDHDHLFGSHVLTEMGSLIKQNIRNHDFAARYGGDEFLICLTQITSLGAEEFCERLRKIIESHLFKNHEDEIRLTASMGCTVIVNGKSLMDGRSLVRHADHGLYQSKEEGRNRVILKEIEEEMEDVRSHAIGKRRKKCR